MDAVQRDVAANAPAQRVFDELTLAQQEATAAAGSDPIYVALKSGIDAVEKSLRANDPVAARVGIDVVRYQCGLLRGGTVPTP